MICTYCGRELPQDTRFCTYCGREQVSAPAVPVNAASPVQPSAPKPQAAAQKPKSVKGKPILFGVCGTAAGAILLAVILLIAGVFPSGGGGKIEGPGFNTPEDAAKAYLKGLKEQDLDAMLSAFAVETYVDNYDFQAYMERMKTYAISMELLFPNGESTRRMNIEGRRESLATQILFQYMMYNAPDELSGGMSIQLKNPGDVEDFMEDLERDTEDYVFEDLTVTAALSSAGLPDDPEDALDMLMERLPEDLREELEDNVSEDEMVYMLEKYLNGKNQENILKQAEPFGVKDEANVASVAVIFEADNDTWVFCPQAVRYNGKWYLQTHSGNLAVLMGITVYAGGIVPLGMF